MMRLISFNAALVALAIFACASCQSAATNKLASLCEVAVSPRDYLDRTIVVRANIITDGLHGVAIVDPRCSARGMVLNIPIAVRAQADVAELRNTIFVPGGGGTTGRVVAATLTGKLDPPVQAGGGYAFVLAQVSNIESKREPGSPM